MTWPALFAQPHTYLRPGTVTQFHSADVAAGDHDQYQPDRLRPDQANSDGTLRRRAMAVARAGRAVNIGPPKASAAGAAARIVRRVSRFIVTSHYGLVAFDRCRSADRAV
jgi:hypothetical protein